MDIDDLMLDISQSVEIKAPIEEVFRQMLHRFGEGNTNPKGELLQMRLEQWPGGRWYRDRGNGIGHLWGHVQVIKPPVLLELSGPMFMSYPATNHMELRLKEAAGGTRLHLRHRAIGMIDPAHRAGVSTGWAHILDCIAKDLAPETAAQRT